MQIYKSPGGALYFVVEGVVYRRPVGAPVETARMTVNRYLELITGGLLTFHKIIKPIMLQKH